MKFMVCEVSIIIIRLAKRGSSGDIVRTGPNMLSINTAGALKTIYASGKANTKKGWWYEILPATSNEWTTHSTIDREYHAYRRRVMSHAFSDNAIRNAEHFILENVRKFTNLLAETRSVTEGDGRSKNWNMAEWATNLNFDVMGDLAFGKTFDCLGSEKNRWVPDLILGATGFVYFVRFARQALMFNTG